LHQNITVEHLESMRATTIKVDGELLRELERLKPASRSLGAYVRCVLQREVLRQKMAAAERYTEFVRATPDEKGLARGVGGGRPGHAVIPGVR